MLISFPLYFWPNLGEPNRFGSGPWAPTAHGQHHFFPPLAGTHNRRRRSHEPCRPASASPPSSPPVHHNRCRHNQQRRILAGFFAAPSLRSPVGCYDSGALRNALPGGCAPAVRRIAASSHRRPRPLAEWLPCYPCPCSAISSLQRCSSAACPEAAASASDG